MCLLFLYKNIIHLSSLKKFSNIIKKTIKLIKFMLKYIMNKNVKEVIRWIIK